MAPEILAGNVYNPKQADLFSAAVVLFIMYTSHCPFTKATISDKYYRPVVDDDFEKFWEIHATSNGKVKEFPESFKDLFGAMINLYADKRLTIEQIKAHEWYNGPVPTPVEIQAEFISRKERNFYSTTDVESSDDSQESEYSVIPDASITPEKQDSIKMMTSKKKKNCWTTVSSSRFRTRYYNVGHASILVDILCWF